MSLLVFQHEAAETTAALGDALVAEGHRLRVVRLDQGQPMPVDFDGVDGVISLGGTMNVDQVEQYPYLQQEMDYLREAHRRGTAVVGCCLGAQLIAAALGGEVGPMDRPEVGWADVKLAFPGTIDPVFQGLPWDSSQLHMHGQEVKALPEGATPLASSAACRHQAFKVGLRTYAFQYHFEWRLEHLKGVACGYDLVQSTGQSAESIMTDSRDRYAVFRHLGDRLCRNIAMLLFPIDKR